MLTDSVARFQADVERLAIVAVHAAVAEELARRRAELAAAQRVDRQPWSAPEPKAASSRRPRSAKPRTAQVAAPQEQREIAAPEPSAPPVNQLELFTGPPAPSELAPATEVPPSVEAAATQPAAPAVTEAPVAPSSVPQVPPTVAGKPGTWTRDEITAELAKWLVSGTKVDAWFLKNYAPRGFLPATLRLFGPLEAALLAARLRVAKLYPHGPPAGTALRQRRGEDAAGTRAR